MNKPQLIIVYCVSLVASLSLAQVHVGHTRLAHQNSSFVLTDGLDETKSVWGLSLQSKLELSPLSFQVNRDEALVAIEQRLLSAISLRYVISDSWSLLAQSEVLSHQEGAGLGENSPLAKGIGMGRHRVALRWQQAMADSSLLFALQPEIMAPSSAADPLYGGNNWIGAVKFLVGQGQATQIRWTANLGYEHRKAQTVGHLVSDSRWQVDLGLAVPLNSFMDLTTEGQFVIGEFDASAQSSVQKTFHLGAIARFNENLGIKLGAGRGLSGPPGTPDYSFIAGIELLSPSRPSDAAKNIANNPPLSLEKSSSAPLVMDADNDGIGDHQDGCPYLGEDKDGHQDGDGCPDLDNDFDGIYDHKDEDPQNPEDFDGVQDHDGLPEPDNDSDGLSDGIDLCPNHPGVGQGCPESTFDWRQYVMEVNPVADGFSVTNDAYYIFAPQTELGIDFESKVTQRIVAEVAGSLLKQHSWSRFNVVATYCPQDKAANVPREETALSQAKIVSQMLVDASISPNRVGFLASPRYGFPNDSCRINLMVKRLSAFEGIGNQLSSAPTTYTSSTEVSPDRTAKTLDISFIPSGFEPTLSSASGLLELAELVRRQGRKFELIVHTDALGDLEQKLLLSQRRAERLRSILVDLGVDGQSFTVMGMGSKVPIADNQTANGRKSNNRVELRFLEEMENQN